MAITVVFTPSVTTLATSVGGVSTFTMTDISTYVSPSRSGYGVYLTTYKTDFSGGNSPVTSAQNATPTTSSVWTVNFTSDGWYQSYFSGIPNYSAGTYNLNDAAYVVSNQTTWLSIIASNSNALTGTGGTGWVQVIDPTRLALNAGLSNQSNNIITAIINFVQYPLTEQQAGKQVSSAFLEESTSSKRTKDVRNYNLVALALNGMKYAAKNGNYAQAEIYARRITYYFI